MIHHGGTSIYNDVKPLIKPLAEQGRVTLVTLGEHVTKNVRADVEDWAERELFLGWETLPIKTLVPVSRARRAAWPFSGLEFLTGLRARWEDSLLTGVDLRLPTQPPTVRPRHFPDPRCDPGQPRAVKA